MVLQSDPMQVSTKPLASSLEGIERFFSGATVDPNSHFCKAFNMDRHAAAIISGVSGLDLNTFILKTEMNDVNQSVSEDDVKQLKKILWGVMIPYTTWNLKRVFPFPEDAPATKSNPQGGSNNNTNNSNTNNTSRTETETWKLSDRENEKNTSSNRGGQKDIYRFIQQNYVLHLTVKIAQSLNLIFELNQKRTFSALAIAAYAEAIVDVLCHPHLNGKIGDDDHEKLTHYLRRHPRYSNIFNIFTGHKLLRQYSMRASAPAANRKANDVWVQLNISAANMHNLLDRSPSIAADFKHAKEEYTMQWNDSYYIEVAKNIKEKLTSLDADMLDEPNQEPNQGAENAAIQSHITDRVASAENPGSRNKRDWREEEAGVFLPQLSMEERNQLPTKTRRIVDALSRPTSGQASEPEEPRPFSILKMFH